MPVVARSKRFSSRVGEQFDLDLFPGVPWGGRSPRGLTRVRLGLIFNARAEEPRGFSRDQAQLVLWPVSKKPRRRKRLQQAAGAPTLLPLRPVEHPARRARRGYREGFEYGETT